jgi:hypothetical protein
MSILVRSELYHHNMYMFYQHILHCLPNVNFLFFFIHTSHIRLNMKTSGTMVEQNVSHIDQFKSCIDMHQNSTNISNYKNIPLATSSKRGILIEQIVKEKENGTDPDIDYCVNGAKRGRNSTSYDFKKDTRRVEVKSAQFSYDFQNRMWHLHFKNIKFECHDELLLCAYCPYGVFVYAYDGSLDSLISKRIDSDIRYTISMKQEEISKSWEIMHEKLKHMFKYKIDFAEIGQTFTTTEFHYRHAPLQHLKNTRGKCIEHMCRLILTKQGKNVTNGVVQLKKNGTRRSLYTNSYDFIVNGKRCEIKSSQMYFDIDSRRWKCTFRNVKKENYDDLLLCAYTPFGIFIFRHDGNYGFCRNGKGTELKGFDIKIQAQRNNFDVYTAWTEIFEKMQDLELVHTIAF